MASKVGDPVDPSRLGVAVVRDIIDMPLFSSKQIVSQWSSIPRNGKPPARIARVFAYIGWGSTHEAIHLAPSHLLAVNAAASAGCQEAFAPCQELPPFGRESTQHCGCARHLLRRTTEDDAFSHSRPEVWDPALRRRRRNARTRRCRDGILAAIASGRKCRDRGGAQCA